MYATNGVLTSVLASPNETDETITAIDVQRTVRSSVQEVHHVHFHRFIWWPLPLIYHKMMNDSPKKASSIGKPEVLKNKTRYIWK